MNIRFRGSDLFMFAYFFSNACTIAQLLYIRAKNWVSRVLIGQKKILICYA